MRMTLPILIGLLFVTAVSALAVSSGNLLLPTEQKLPGSWTDMPVSTDNAGVRADTTWYGDYQVIGGVYYARSFTGTQVDARTNIAWTFDRGNGPINPPAPLINNGEGWSVRDLTANSALYFRVIDNTLQIEVSPPIISGAKSLWVGADKPQADALCWPCGSGYGNEWCQRVVSEALSYNGSGNVTLELKYFNDSEPCYDGTQIYLKRADNTELLLNPYPQGTCTNNTGWLGGFTDSIGAYTAPLVYNRVITAAEIGGAQNVHLIIEFTSDGGWSDEDCQWSTERGPFGADDITVNGGGIAKNYTFETGFEGWTPGFCAPVGDYVGIVDMDGCYTILDPCSCRLSNNVLEMHADDCDAGVHPVGQHIMIMSPIVDTGDENLKTLFMQFDMYAELPRECGVLIRPGWQYYPWLCEITGSIGWSDRIGQDAYNYFGTDPVCATWRYGGTDLGAAGVPVPNSARSVIAIIELLGDCSSFTIDPCQCPGGNFTPLFDNLMVAQTGAINAPLIGFDIGTRYQDTGTFDPANPNEQRFNPRAFAPANVTVDKYMDNQAKPDLCGDSLVVSGPLPGSDPNKRWEARMWFRIGKKGPFQADKENGITTNYKTWRDRVADGLQIDRPYKPQFTFGWMDSVQQGVVPVRNKFLSNFRENDDDFQGEGNAQSEMIWDNVLYPGTRVDYFITSNYVNTPNSLYWYPDTTGGFYFEFEVLPGVRVANVANCGGAGFNFCAYHPATLYIDFFNGGSQPFIENALAVVLNGATSCALDDVNDCPIPVDRNWDRYDYLDGSSNWNAPFARGLVLGSNNGMTLNQILGYRAIVGNTGTYSAGATQEEDWQLFDQWLISPDCNANANRQVFVLNGDKTGEVLEGLPTYGLPFLNNTLGATLFCDAFNGVSQDPDCAPEDHSFCLRLLPVGGGPFGTLIDVDAWGSWCPALLGFNVFATTTGTGNRIYDSEEGPKVMQYEQVVRTNLGAAANYKTVIDGVSWHHMTRRNAAGSGETYCPRTTLEIVEGSLSEIKAALQWGFDVPDPNGIPKLANVKDLATCEGTWGSLPADVDDSGILKVNRLFQNEPNPFNPRTTIKFSLAQSGPVQIEIYDVNGRLVKTLVKNPMDAGTHAVVWDGTNDSGKKVGSGVFWSQMKAGSFVSNKKMVILK